MTVFLLIVSLEINKIAWNDFELVEKGCLNNIVEDGESIRIDIPKLHAF